MSIAAFANSYFVWLFTLLLLSLLMMPSIRFLRVGWHRKKEDIISGLSDESIRLYFKHFYPNEKLDENNVRETFESNFDHRFGRQHFALPMILLILIAGVQLFLLGGTVAVWLKIIPKTGGVLPPIVAAAMSGAYMWVLTDMISRNQRLDLAPVSLSWGAFRFVTAVPFAYAFAHLFAESLAIPIAFLIGVFPVRMLRSLAFRIAVRNLNVGEFGEQGVNELERLQCVNTTNAETFSNEGVNTILQLAYADPVDLTIRTGFSFSYVIDCASQALAWIYFQDKLEKMRIYSLRGAQEIFTLIDELDNAETKDVKKNAKIALNKIAAQIEMDVDALERTFREIAEDPYTCFLCDVWQ